MYGKLQFPPHFQLFFQNTYSDQVFYRLRAGWTSMFAFFAKKREKANINENIETLNFSVLYGKLWFPSEILLFLQNTDSDQFFLQIQNRLDQYVCVLCQKLRKAKINENTAFKF